MARGGKIGSKHKTRKKILLEKKESDESDEDYMVGEDEEFDESEDEYCFSPAEDESEESKGEFDDDDDEEEEEVWKKKKVKKIQRPRGRKVFQGRKNAGVIKPTRKKVAHSDEEEDHVKDKFDSPRQRNKGMLSRIKEDEDEDEDEDYDFDDSESENDEEFTPDEIDSGDDEEDLPLTKRNKLGRLRMPVTAIAKRRKRKRNAKIVKRTRRKKRKKEQVVRRYNRSDLHNTSRDRNSILQKKKKISEHRGRRKKSSVNSDSNFVNSGSSDHEYTISEEEREQVREAVEFCGRLTSSLRNSSSLKMIKEEEIVPSQRQHPLGTKGKEKVVEMKILAGKQVCGICLSEEGKRTIRGILNCCSHYFCFACIMEWSKVESRCPLCKQRFATISRTAQVDCEFASTETVIPVPERDQVYQPSEEELRAYLDPYENVLCTECQQGGDDALMLLCDLCDSPAHTYCVGLGREVPEGNWYCDGCKPTAIASANALALNAIPENGANYNLSVGSSPGATVRETFDLNELYVPETPMTRVTGHSSSPRQSSGDFQGASPATGSGAFTLYERRRIQRQIYQLLNSRSRHVGRSDGVAQASGISLFGSQIGQDALIAPQHVTPAWMAQENNYYQGRLSDYANPSICRRFSSLRGQILDNQAAASTDHSFGGLSHNEYAGINSRIGRGLGHQQLQPCSSRSKSGDDTSISMYQFREVSRSPLEKERVQSMVRSHLKSLSRNMELGYTTFKDIARTSTHTILAAVGVEHRWNEVYPVRTRPLNCDHFESRNTCPTGGQCSSCFDWFVRSVVSEIMYTRVSPSSMG